MKAKVYQYRNELRSIKKGPRTMAKYLLRIKAIVDALVAIGNDVPEHEHIQSVLEGLPEEYHPFITSVNVRSGNISVSELQALLISKKFNWKNMLSLLLKHLLLILSHKSLRIRILILLILLRTFSSLIIIIIKGFMVLTIVEVATIILEAEVVVLALLHVVLNPISFVKCVIELVI